MEKASETIDGLSLLGVMVLIALTFVGGCKIAIMSMSIASSACFVIIYNILYKRKIPKLAAFALIALPQFQLFVGVGMTFSRELASVWIPLMFLFTAGPIVMRHSLKRLKNNESALVSASAIAGLVIYLGVVGFGMNVAVYTAITEDRAARNAGMGTTQSYDEFVGSVSCPEKRICTLAAWIFELF